MLVGPAVDNPTSPADAGGMVVPVHVASTADPAVSVAPLSRAAYDQLVELGHFEDRRVELLEGVLVEMPPMSDRHAMAIVLLTRWLVRGLPEPLALRPQLPLATSEYSEPEPDIAVTPLQRTAAGHPTTALLAVEVTLTTHHTDLVVKPRLYAAAGVPRYWVVDLAGGRVVEHTRPGDGGYAEVVVHTPPVVLEVEGVPIDLAALLA
jgi:Uma2 family endonuclease